MSDDDVLGAEDEAPKIIFPCPYPIKVIGPSVEGFTDLVVSIVRQHDPEFDPSTIEHNDSRHGAYRSVRLIITATGKDQLQAMFDDLKASGQVKMVL